MEIDPRLQQVRSSSQPQSHYSHPHQLPPLHHQNTPPPYPPLTTTHPPPPAYSSPQQLASQSQPTGIPSPPTPSNSGANGSSGTNADHKRLACGGCRGLKVRCEPNDPNNPTGICRRCAKANRECVFTPPTRKRQKKADSKVAELERKIDALTASLNATRHGRIGGLSDDDEEDEYEADTPGSMEHPRGEPISPADGRMSNKRRRRGDMFNDPGNVHHRYEALNTMPQNHPHAWMHRSSRVVVPAQGGPTVPQLTSVDVIDQQLLSIEMAKTFFNRYRDNMSKHFPAVVFTDDVSIEEVRRNTPTLFLAILAAAASSSHPDLYRALNKEVTLAFAERIMINGEKNIELVKALLVITVWYYPPDRWEHLKFYMLIHTAAVMAVDLGLAGSQRYPHSSQSVKPLTKGAPMKGHGHSISEKFKNLSTEEKSTRPSTGDEPPTPSRTGPTNPFPDPTTIDSRRTYLAVYWSCSNAAVGMRKPHLLRYSKYVGECIDVLENSPEALESDKVLCWFVRLQRISEDMSQTFGFDDHSADISFQDQRIQLSLKGFARQLEEWRHNIPPRAFTSSLQLKFHTVTLFTYEIALHVDHNVDDFRPPFTDRMLGEPAVAPDAVLSPFHLDAILMCMNTAHIMIDTFLSIPFQRLNDIPVVNFVRTAYSTMILIKIYMTAAVPGSELGKLINKEDVHLDEYLDKTVHHFSQAAAGDRTRPSGKFTMIVIMLKLFFTKRRTELEKKYEESAKKEAAKENMDTDDDTEDSATDTTTTASHAGHPQTPLQMLSQAAVSGLSPAPKTPSYTTTMNPQIINGQMGYGDQYGYPQGVWGGVNLANIVEFQAGDFNLGLGGAGSEAFTDDTFWGLMDQTGMSMSWTNNLQSDDMGF